MVLFNHSTRELTAKIVYYGPGLCGKTTNLRLLHDRLDRGTVGRLLSLSTAQDRTIYFDLLPVELGNIKGYTVRFQLCTVPGQVFYNETRKLVLRGVDGIVFVVDSQWSMLSHNLESFQNLKENLDEQGLSLDQIPLVIQFNKRDLPGVLPVETLQESLGFGSYAFVDAVASEGRGVVETFRLVSKLTFVDLLRRLQRPGGGLELDPGVLDDTMPDDQASTVQIQPLAPPVPPVPAPVPASAAAEAEPATPPPAAKPASRAPRDDSSWLRLFAPREERKALLDQLGLGKSGKVPRAAVPEPAPAPPPAPAAPPPVPAPAGESPFETSSTWLSPEEPKTGDVFADSAGLLLPPPPAAPEAPPPAPEPAFADDSAEPSSPFEAESVPPEEAPPREPEPAPPGPEVVTLAEAPPPSQEAGPEPLEAPEPGPEPVPVPAPELAAAPVPEEPVAEPVEAVTAVLEPPAVASEPEPAPPAVAPEAPAPAVPSQEAAPDRSEASPEALLGLEDRLRAALVESEKRLLETLVPRDELDELRASLADEMAGLRAEVAEVTSRLRDATARSEETAGQLRALQAEVAEARSLAGSAREEAAAATAREPGLAARLSATEESVARLAGSAEGAVGRGELAALESGLGERLTALSEELSRAVGSLEPFVMRHEEDRTALRSALEALASREEGERLALARRLDEAGARLGEEERGREEAARQLLETRQALEEESARLRQALEAATRSFEGERSGLSERVELLGAAVASLRQDVEAAVVRAEERAGAAEGTSRKLLSALRSALEE